MGVTVRITHLLVTFAGNLLTSGVLSATGTEAADSGWPSCDVLLAAKPGTGNEEDTLVVEAGGTNTVVRFTGRVRAFRPTANPKQVLMQATGTLAYAADWSPDADIELEELMNGEIATDENMIIAIFNHVVRCAGDVDPGDIEGTGIVLGDEVPESFTWRKGVSAWSQIQSIDRATLFRTYQTRTGKIKRISMIGHPNDTPNFTLSDEDILDGSTGGRETLRTRNAVIVHGHDYGRKRGQALGLALGNNDFQGDASDTANRYPETFDSDLIENGNDEDGVPLLLSGLDAQAQAETLLLDVNKEFVDADVISWRDDTHGPGLTCLLDLLARMIIGEPMWTWKYTWAVGEDGGWTSRYGLSGGGEAQTYDTPEV